MKIDNKLILEYSKNLNILYVEDDENLRNTTGEIFKNYFLKVDYAIDGMDALEKYNAFFKNTGTKYDLIISDINMPKMNGVEMASLILEESYDQSIIFITAHNEVEYLQRSIDLGVDGFITKPIKPEQLKKVLYKVSQSVYDRKMARLHYDVIEKLNVDLQMKNEELEKSLRVLNTIVEQKNASITPHKELEEPSQIDLFVHNDIEKIEKLHQEIDTNVVLVINSKDDNLKTYIDSIAKGFSDYASILSFYSSFHELSGNMKEFSVVLQNSELPKDSTVIHDIFVLLESFMFVLEKWGEKLKDGDSEKLNYLDASLISDMQTIITMWTMSEESDGGDV